MTKTRIVSTTMARILALVKMVSSETGLFVSVIVNFILLLLVMLLPRPLIFVTVSANYERPPLFAQK